MLDALRREQRKEHRLAMLVGMAVQPLHAALAEQRSPDRFGRRTDAREAPRVVEQLGCLGARHADRGLQEEACLEQVAFQTLAAIADKTIGIVQQRERAVEGRIAWHRGHVALSNN
jgi:hypothetical protein